MVVSSIVLMITFCYICFEMARRRNFDVPWMKACCGCLVAGLYIKVHVILQENLKNLYLIFSIESKSTNQFKILATWLSVKAL